MAWRFVFGTFLYLECFVLGCFVSGRFAGVPYICPLGLIHSPKWVSGSALMPCWNVLLRPPGHRPHLPARPWWLCLWGAILPLEFPRCSPLTLGWLFPLASFFFLSTAPTVVEATGPCSSGTKPFPTSTSYSCCRGTLPPLLQDWQLLHLSSMSVPFSPTGTLRISLALVPGWAKP